MINFNFGASLKALTVQAGVISEASASLPTVVNGSGIAAYVRQVPVTGFSIVFPNMTTALILAPVGTLATGAVTLPANPLDGQLCYVLSSQTVTGLTVSPNVGQTLNGGVTTIPANSTLMWVYCLAVATWYRVI
jgi:hypothetical protein